MPIADDWTIDYIDKKVSHVQFKDEITGSDSSVAKVNTITCAADSSNSLDGDYFYLYSATDTTAYYVWYNTSGGSAPDPAPAGFTEIEVAITTNDTAAAVATATSAAINSVAGTDFTSTVVNSTTVQVTNDAKGSATSAVAGASAPNGFTYNIEKNTVQCVADSSNSLDGDYFVLYSANDATKYHVWYNTSGGSAPDPAPAGSVGIEVAIATDAAASAVASATQAAVDVMGDFVATVSTDTVTITNAASGPSTDVANGVGLGAFTYTTLVNPIKGIGKTVWSVNALYSYLQDQFDELGNMDDKVPMDAQTPTEYRFINNWFIDEVSIKYLKGGAIKTSGWTSGQIIQQKFQSGGYTNVVASDIGKIVTETDTGDTGNLLFADNTRRRWWIKPDVPGTGGDEFDDSGSAYTIGSGTGAGTSTAAALSGENTWANMFTLGTIEANTAIYVVQDSAKVSAWWPVGQIDVLLRVLEAGVTTGDSGAGDIRDIFIGAREYSKLYDHFISNNIDGGRNPVPLATAADLNNTTGQYQTVFADSSGTWAAGETFTKNGDPTFEGTVTSVSGSNPTVTMRYYLSGTSLTPFVNGNAVTASGGATGTIVTPTNVVAGYTDVTFTFAYTTENLNNGAGAKPYDCTIDLGGRTVAQMYEWLKFVTRRGATTSPQLKTGTGTIAVPAFANINGEQYIKLLDGTLAVDNFTPVKASPFGTFAGGKFFGAQGVWITNYAAADAQNFQLIDSNGDTQVPPNTVSVTVSNLRQNDVTGVFVLTGVGGTIDKAQFNMTSQAANLNTITVGATIDPETPQAGVIRVVDVSDSLRAEQQYQYASWSGAVFTLNSFPASGNNTVTGGSGTSTILTDTDLSGANNFVDSNIRPGDIVTNVTDGSTATVVTVDSGTQITTTGLTGGADNTFTNTDEYNITTETNRAYTSSPQDTAYAPIINAKGVYYSATATNFSAGTGADDDNPASMSNTLIKGAGGDIPVLVRVRRGSSGISSKILPFEIAQAVGQSGMSQAAIRTLDSIVT